MKKSQDNPPLKVQNLSKFYGSLQAVNQVTFEVQPGEVFGLLGPNGAGKTSIISTIVTLEEPTQGKIEIFGHDVQKDPLTAKSYVGWVPQEVINHGFFNICEIIKTHPALVAGTTGAIKQFKRSHNPTGRKRRGRWFGNAQIAGIRI